MTNIIYDAPIINGKKGEFRYFNKNISKRFLFIAILSIYILLCISLICLITNIGTSQGNEELPNTPEKPIGTFQCCGEEPLEGSGTFLYMKGSDATQGKLSKDIPKDSQSKSATILPDTGLLERYIGTWTSEPLKYEWIIEGFVEIQIATYGNGYSYSTYFRIEITINDKIVAETEINGAMRPDIKYRNANTAINITIFPGEEIGFNIYVTENGPGGELRWDSEKTLGMLWIHTQSTKVTIKDEQKDGVHITTLYVSSTWGCEDIDDFGIIVTNPPKNLGENYWSDLVNGTIFTTEDQSVGDYSIVDNENGSIISIWRWEEPEKSSSLLVVLGFAYEGRDVPVYYGKPIEKNTQMESKSDRELLSGKTGVMFVIGLVILIATIIYYFINQRREIFEIEYEEDSTSTSPNIDKLVVFGAFLAVFLIITPIFLVMTESTESEKQDFTLSSIDGKEFKLSDFRGKVVFLDLGGVSCAGCEEVLGHMKSIYPDVKDKGVIFISINVVPSDKDEDLIAWRNINNIPTENWIIAQDTANLVVKYNAFKIPRLIVINKEGYITYEHTGATSESNINKTINEAVEGKATAIEMKDYGIWGLAFLAGVAMFFSPCAFPLLPGYIMLYFQMREEDNDKKKGYTKAAKTGTIAALGIFTVIIAFGLVFAIASDIIGNINWDHFIYIVAFILGLFGILMLFNMEFSFIISPFQQIIDKISSIFKRSGGDKGARAIENIIGKATRSEFTFKKAKKEGQLGIYLFGLGYGGVSAGCHAPIFLAIFLATLEQGFFQALFIFVLFALGMGFIMIIITLLLATAKTRAVYWLRDNTDVIRKITGLAMIVIAAVLIVSN